MSAKSCGDIRTKISFLVDKHDAGMPHVYISKEEETGSVLPFLVSQLAWRFGTVQTNEVCHIFLFSEQPVYLFPRIAEEPAHTGCTMGD